jgi:nitroimidazol reductase NimA-like FMN-containing flavoprotein (pyridoxamine 5'-phosphate oxidase superfamily)
MGATDRPRDRNGLEVLDRDECLQLLATATLGRIGVTAGALPSVFPVNFWFDGESILVRTGPGTTLDAASRHSVVAFEVDDIDAMSHTGWSVMVTGEATAIEDPDELARFRHAPLPHWARALDDPVLVIEPALVSGRRITAGRY